MSRREQPQVFRQLITDTAGHGARYLELQKANGRFELRALFASSWKVLDIPETSATEIWDWATGTITSRRGGNGSGTGSQRPRAMELVGRFSPDALSRRSLTRLTLRLMGRPGTGSQDTGTLAMRMTDVPV